MLTSGSSLAFLPSFLPSSIVWMEQRFITSRSMYFVMFFLLWKTFATCARKIWSCGCGSFSDEEVFQQSALIWKDIFSPRSGTPPLVLSATSDSDRFISVPVRRTDGSEIMDMVQISGHNVTAGLREQVFSKADLAKIPPADRFDKVGVVFSDEMVHETVMTRRMKLLVKFLPSKSSSYEIWNNRVVNPKSSSRPSCRSKVFGKDEGSGNGSALFLFLFLCRQ